MPARTGKFTVREVEERTGVRGTSLRQWERRYGYPKPERSASGYRYFSERDLAAIERIRDLVADGVPPSRATAMVRETVAEPAGVRSASVLARELGDALVRVEAEAAERVLSEALGFHPVPVVLLEVVRPALVRIGDMWHAGEVSVATEHFASNLLQGRLRAIMRLVGNPGGGAEVIVSCVPGEQHEVGILILAIMLRRAGIRVTYLGADTPLADLVKMTTARDAGALLLSATTRKALAGLVEEGGVLRELPGLLVLGGPAVAAEPELAAEVGGIFLGNDVRKVVPELRALLRRAQPGRPPA